MILSKSVRQYLAWSVAVCVLVPIVGCKNQKKSSPQNSDASANANQFSLGNHWLMAQGTAHDGHWAGLRVTDRATGHSISFAEAFSLQLQGQPELRSSAMELTKPFHLQDLKADPSAARYAARLDGKEVCAEFKDQKSQLRVDWCGVLRKDSNYFRQKLTFYAGSQPLSITQVRLLDVKDANARVDGTVKGSPIVDGNMFFGFEDPLSLSQTQNGETVAFMPRQLPLQADRNVSYSSVIGVTPAGQMRRGFLRYIERERAHPYRPFLQYNSWYDLAKVLGEPYDETVALNRINDFGNELTKKRGVTVRSFVFDDGWDNWNSLWDFNSGFPDGFHKVDKAAAKYGSHIGLWLSPWGGYHKPKQERVAFGRKHGYEIVNGGFALSAPKYYAKFQQICLDMISKYGANEFKFDGTGNADHVFPGSEFDSDFVAMIHLIRRLRQAEPNIFINLTTGTYPSPFWLRYSDVVWRGGHDHGFAGVGSSRQRWITYRDAQVYHYIVQQAPLFPLNSLMLHGMIFGRLAVGLTTDPNHDFPDEVKSFFGSGTQVQEMYITPSLLTQKDWDVLAQGAKWSLANAETLKDTHWIGGDPAKLQVYGWAAWSPKKAIITLRNPSNKPQTYVLHVKDALQLPAGAPQEYLAHDPWNDSAGHHTTQLAVGHPLEVKLQPWEVRTFDAVPSQPSSAQQKD